MDAASTSEAVGFITLMQDLKRKLHSWEQQLEVREEKRGRKWEGEREGEREGGRERVRREGRMSKAIKGEC